MNTLNTALPFQDYCIIQRHKPIRIWGTSLPGHEIIVILNRHSSCTLSNSQGSWQVIMPSMEVCLDTQLEILDESAGEHILYSHVAIGEVWIAGGQSNMEFLMRYDDDRYRELHREENSHIRYFEVPHLAFEDDPMDISNSGKWRICDKENLEYFSAVGYYFARDLEQSLHVPVGIIACNWGGTTALTWMPRALIQENPQLKPYWDAYEDETKNLDLKEYQTSFIETRQKLNKLSKSSHQQIQHWISREDQLKFVRENLLEEYGLVPPLPMGPWHHNSPGKLYESMLLRIAGLSVRGVIWYQGESDIDRCDVYDILFRSVIQSWRELWREELPWLFVQLAPFYKWLDQDGSRFPAIRQKQELVSKTVPGTWMACIMDCGLKWGIHPTRKKYVGKRLSLLARGKVYHEPVACESPECIKAIHRKNQIVLTFLHAEEGMELHDDIQNDLYIVCGRDKIEIKHIDCHGDIVIATFPEFTGRVDSVEFLNVPYGEDMLYNSAGLPAKPFVIELEHNI